jgi:hypothetical protein
MRFADASWTDQQQTLLPHTLWIRENLFHNVPQELLALHEERFQRVGRHQAGRETG